MLDDYLVQSCDLITKGVNDYGDFYIGGSQTLSCRWRDIPAINKVAHTDMSTADSMVWFASGAPVVRGSMLLFEGNYYEVTKVYNARRLGDTTVQFIKCEVEFRSIGMS